MSDITTFSYAELLADRDASEQDIRLCQFALSCGYTHHKDGCQVQERLEVNQNIIKKIDAELERRKVVA